MLNKKGGIEADLTVSTLDEQGWDGSSHLFPVSSLDTVFTCGKTTGQQTIRPGQEVLV